MENVTHPLQPKTDGEWLKFIVDESGFSAEEVGRKAGLGKATIYNYYKKEKLELSELSPVLIALFLMNFKGGSLDIQQMPPTMRAILEPLFYGEFKFSKKEGYISFKTKYEQLSDMFIDESQKRRKAEDQLANQKKDMEGFRG